ncbi:DNA polymerase delta subunit 4 isoform X4 [Dasypus novemcinctus]|uniref:DNA polymerase delta subunit 4 isoform X4 n=1 Tax=Dasypus novemcinctus TaxID=9361 RepID=UPI00062A8565
MGRKRLITDSYPVVKRREGPAGHSKGELAPELEEEPQAPDVDEADLELLRQFDLAWQYGPCTALFLGLRSVEAPKTHPYTFSSLGSSSTPKRPQCHLPTLQPLASLSTLKPRLGPPAFGKPASYPRASGQMGEPAALLWRNTWQERVSQGRKQT